MTTARRSRGFCVALGIFAFALYTAAVAAPMTLNGTVSYRERVALPPSAVAEVKLHHVNANRSETAPGLAGRWLAEDIRGGGVIDNLQSVLEIAGDGGVSGTGGCNRMAGKAVIAGDKITIGPLASTRMACTPAVMNQERKFFDALGDVRAWRVDPVRRKLALLDADGRPILVLARM